MSAVSGDQAIKIKCPLCLWTKL